MKIGVMAQKMDQTHGQGFVNLANINHQLILI